MDHAVDFTPAALEQHRAFLRRVARALVRGEAAADDLVQETFLRALQRPPRAASALRAWLGRVAARIASNQRRGEERLSRRERVAALPEAVAAHDEALASLELQQRLLAALKVLDEPYRTTLWLRWHEGQSIAAIAERERLTVKGVEARVTRGLAALRAELDRRSGGERSRWFAGVATLAGFGGGGAVASAAVVAASAATSGGVSAMPAAAGAWAMKKAALAAAVVVLSGVSWWWGNAEPARPDPLRNAAAPAASPAPPPPASTAGVVADRQETPATESPPSPLPDGALATLLVFVTGPDQGPVADVLLFAAPEAAADAPRVVFEQRSGSDGCARFEALVPGAVRVEADRGATVRTHVVAGAENEVALQLAGGIDVEGRVVDEAGAPVAGAELLYVSPRRDWLAARVVGRSRDDGSFTVRELARGGHLSARALGYVPAFLEPLPAVAASPRRDVTLTLDWRGVGVSGRVLDPAGRPVAGALVAAGTTRNQGYGDRSGAMRQRFGMPIARTDADGRFELVGVEHQSLDLAVMADGYPVQVDELPRWVGLVSYAEVKLAPPAHLTVTIRDPSGSAVSGAVAQFAALGGRRAEWIPFPLPRATTDAAGSARLDLVAAGTAPLRVTPPAGSPWKEITTQVELAAGEARAIEVCLADESAIIGSALDAEGRALQGVVVRWLSWDERRERTTTLADDGSFRLAPCDRPPYELALVRSVDGAFLQRLDEVWPGPDQVELVVAAPAAIVGAFIDDDAVPRADEEAGGEVADRARGGEAVSALAGKPDCFVFDRGRTVGVNADWDGDSFACRNLPPGTYRLTVRNDAVVLWQSEWLTLAAGETRDVGLVRSQRLRPEAPGAVHIEVAPADAVNVSAVIRGTDFEVQAFLRQEGDRWRADGLAAGSLFVEVRADGRATALVPMTIEPGAIVPARVDLLPGVARTLRFAGEWDDLAVAIRDRQGRICAAERLVGRDPKGVLILVADGDYQVEAISNRGQRAVGRFEVRGLAAQDAALVYVLE